jgi:hypothetical protein
VPVVVVVDRPHHTRSELGYLGALAYPCSGSDSGSGPSRHPELVNMPLFGKRLCKARRAVRCSNSEMERPLVPGTLLPVVVVVALVALFQSQAMGQCGGSENLPGSASVVYRCSRGRRRVANT